MRLEEDEGTLEGEAVAKELVGARGVVGVVGGAVGVMAATVVEGGRRVVAALVVDADLHDEIALRAVLDHPTSALEVPDFLYDEEAEINPVLSLRLAEARAENRAEASDALHRCRCSGGPPHRRRRMRWVRQG